ncbi:MerR family transcriptional regulator [Campylobacter sp. MIT 12-8780]|uniref:MerR family transcriptional regulator n=1 Tax=unclassified Campylobacter TaxID=2593542 RepID=UPI0010F8C7E1|nr:MULTISPECIES: MerR family transcriptional regulator [unclassified Campylobacter]NDJ27121.1 MerR family transcriptional regulator [Campylobacter sp. MIT 19-121]TKX29650.1 MerR family transcriptional regulator [Campylobacter sp. MIT 12-5580]TQR41581.1 MerR family transcriptional regulator [Campylobacter sp. MIT 12-8780]
MAYTIIEVEKRTAISSRTLRFWASKGLFPFVETDKNGVRYFSQKDLEWALWISFYRSIGMSIEKIKEYIELSRYGVKSAKERKKMIEEQKNLIEAERLRLDETLDLLKMKMDYYDALLRQGKDIANPQDKNYKMPDPTKCRAFLRQVEKAQIHFRDEKPQQKASKKKLVKKTLQA